MPIEAYKELLAFKIESAAGTPEVLADANVIKVTKVDVKPNLEITTRSYSDDVFTRLAHVVAGKVGSITFTVDLAGSGVAATPAPVWAALLTACGMKSADQKSYTFSSTVADYKTATVGAYHEGNFKSLAGAMGTFKVNGGQNAFGSVDFTLTGVWQSTAAPVTLAVPADIVPPLCNGGFFKWNAVARAITQFGLDAGISVKTLKDMGKATGYYRAWIEGRSPTGTFDPEMITGQSMWSDYEAGVERAVAISIGAAPGNTVAIAAGACQLTDLSDGKRDGVRIHNASFATNGVSPFSLTWS